MRKSSTDRHAEACGVDPTKNGYGGKNVSERRIALKARLRKGHLVVAPGIFDMISAKIADGMGFEALYMTGYGTVASHLGLPDAGLADL